MTFRQAIALYNLVAKTAYTSERDVETERIVGEVRAVLKHRDSVAEAKAALAKLGKRHGYDPLEAWEGDGIKQAAAFMKKLWKASLKS